MRRLALTLLLVAAPAVAAFQTVAPAAKRKPAAALPAVPPAQTPVASSAARPAPRPGNERDYAAALAAAGQTGDSALDASLIRVMSRLLASGRCDEAAGLASRDGRRELAAKARQLCR